MKIRLKWLFNLLCGYIYINIFGAIWRQQIAMLDNCYFCGFKVTDWIRCKGFDRFAQWTGMGICHELSALMMVILRGNKTATLYQGYDYDSEGKLIKHAWVEFRVPLFGWYICDLMWLNGFARRREYRRWFPRRMIEWRCTYDEFWSIKLSHCLYEQIQKPATSYVVDELTMYIADEASKFGFTKGIGGPLDLPAEKGQAEYMIPVKVGNEVCWATTMRDFMRNPKAKKPKMRSIRLAESAYKYYLEWRRGLDSI